MHWKFTFKFSLCKAFFRDYTLFLMPAYFNMSAIIFWCFHYTFIWSIIHALVILTFLGHSNLWHTLSHYNTLSLLLHVIIWNHRSISISLWQYIILSENLPSTRFSEVISDSILGMWHPSRTDNDGCRTRPSADTSTYLHRDVRYSQPFQRNRVQDMQKLSITPMQHQHLNENESCVIILFWTFCIWIKH